MQESGPKFDFLKYLLEAPIIIQAIDMIYFKHFFILKLKF